MNTRVMDHEEAMKHLVAERYLLGELNESDRDAYEEHLFACPACFEQVKAGTVFVSQLRHMGVEEPHPARVPGFTASLLPNMRRAATALTFALLLCVSGISLHQHAVIAGLRQAQFMPSLFLSDGAKAEGLKTLTLPPNTRFDLSIQLLQRGDFSSYEGRVLSESEQLKSSIPIPSEQTKETIHLLLDSGVLGQGTYSLVINGLSPNGSKTEVTRYRFRLQLQE